ncbi:MAG: imidazole glycerol phosphate synthase subunit HisH [Acholeplasmataceae bacterium]|nr:imidazole glycerol phosphate synthase subunit HisH [Acholeplasmataceae bacterium]
MNVILDYDVGNLDSVLRGFERVGIKSIVSKDPLVIQAAKSLVLPGVGAFKDAMEALKNSGLIPYIIDHVKQQKYLFGICLGMQLLYEKGYENGEHEGLGILKGSVRFLNIDLKVPQMGWNNLKFQDKNDPILKYIKEDDYVYFVHSYYVDSSNNELISYTEYEKLIPAIVRDKNVYATQFHPEKSGTVGSNILRAYGELIR